MKIFFLLLYLFFPLLLDSNNLNSNRHDQKIFAELNEENNLICANFIIINVNGLVCDFCAQSLEKTFGNMKQIKNVVIGTQDPFHLVKGSGIEKLKKHCNVLVGVCEKECKELNHRFFVRNIYTRNINIYNG